MRGSTYFAIAILLFMGGMAMWSAGLERLDAKLLPLSFSIVGAMLAARQVVKEVKEKAKESHLQEATRARLSPAGMWKRIEPYSSTVGGLGLLVLAIYVIGLPLGVFIYSVAYVKYDDKSWAIAIPTGLALSVFIIVVFGLLLQIDLYGGLFPTIYYYLP